jgi:hypothetical protein
MTTKLDEAKRRWGTAKVVADGKCYRPGPFTPAPRSVAVSFAARVSRVTEQRRDVSAYRLDRSTHP